MSDMTQYYIRKGAGMSLPTRIWYQLHKPRWVSAVYGVIYAACVVLGVCSGLTPADYMLQALGWPIVGLVAFAVVTGGVIGVVAVITGAYWAERSAILGIGVGFLVYLGVTVWLGSHDLIPQFFPLLLCLTAIAFLIVRFEWVSRREYDRERSTRQADAIRAAGNQVRMKASLEDSRAIYDQDHDNPSNGR